MTLDSCTGDDLRALPSFLRSRDRERERLRGERDRERRRGEREHLRSRDRERERRRGLSFFRDLRSLRDALSLSFFFFFLDGERLGGRGGEGEGVSQRAAAVGGRRSAVGGRRRP